MSKNLERYYIKLRGDADIPDATEVPPEKSPLPIEVIPNTMGINLCNVDHIEYTRQSDDQLRDLTIYFIPDSGEG